MSDTDFTKAGLARIAARFPDLTGALHALARTDPAFLDLCEEYELASKSLAGFLTRIDSADRREIAEYRSLIAELETEIGELLRKVS